MSIESPFPFVSVYKMKQHAKVNHHMRLELWGLLDSESAPALMQGQFANASLKITLPDGQDYFTGLPMQIDIQEQNGSFPIYLSCISASFLLDVYPRSASYQDINESYIDALYHVYSREDNASILTSKIADVPVKAPVFQYGETAWAFTLRIAGKLGTYVIPYHREASPKVILGDVGRAPIELAEPDYTAGQNRENGYFHELCSTQQFDLGDAVLHMSRRLLVVEKTSVFKNGDFDNSYVLGTEAGFAVKPHNLLLSGLRLRGSVLAVSGEQLKLHLDIDKIQDVNKAYWFDFVSQSGNVMYCMPQVGTKAMLRFCSNLDSSAVAEECWRENGQDCSALDNYDKRTFTNEFGERLAMFPEALFLTGADNIVGLSDNFGVRIKTNHRTKISAGESITVHAKKNAAINTPQHIYITKPNTTSVIDLAGTEINIDSKNTGVKTKDTPKDKPYPINQVTLTATVSRSLAKAALGFAVMRSGKGAK